MSLKMNTCCCLPLKLGLLIWGYFILGFTAASLLVVLSDKLIGNISIFLYYYFHVHFTLDFITYGAIVFTMQLIFYVIFVVGLHKKSHGLLKVFYNYTIVMLCPKSISSVIVAVYILINLISPETGSYFWQCLTAFSIICTIFFVEFYLLLAVRSYLYVLVENNLVKENLIEDNLVEENMKVENGFEKPSAPPNQPRDLKRASEYTFHLYSYNPYLVSNDECCC